ncbi:MAG TPA: protein kinase, partial [Kofleriaceae bacterium]|nr:protein kinase [Kofleriaceae bacterium]
MIPIDDVVPLAQGGTADLFLARSGRRRVVVKVARDDRPGAAEALATEAAMLARLVASPAPRLIGATRLDGRDALVIEHIDLPVLRAAIAPGAQRPVLDRVALALAVCEAVARVHDAGVVHADLTPDNILVAPATRAVRLIDFGLAAPIGAALAPLITVGYAAPERLVAACRAAASVDVYALGVICYELLAGAPPFQGSARVRSVGHAVGRVPRVSEHVTVSSGVDDAIAQAMAKSPAARPADAGALATLLARAAPVRAAVIRPAAPSARGAIVGFTWPAGVAALRDAVASAGAVIAYSEAGRHVAAIVRGDARASAERLADGLRAAGAVDVELVEIELPTGRRGVPISPAIVELGRRRGRAADPVGDLVAGPVAGPAHGAPPLIGRAGVVSAIAAAARSGTSVLATIWGEVGIGKSRVAEAIGDALARDGLAVIHARAPSLAELADRLDCDRLDPIDRAALGAVTGRTVVDGSAAAPFAAAPGALRQAAARALARALIADRRVLVIDDAHDADPIALDAIELATMDAERGPVVIALARPALAITRRRWGRRAAVLESTALAPLTGEDGRSLIRALLPATAVVPGAALDRLVERCGGVPLYVIELVAALRRAGGGSAVGTRGALPTDLVTVPEHHDVVAWAVADELAALSADTRAVVEAIAVAGRPFAAAEIAPLFAALEAEAVRIELDPGSAVAQLITAGVVVDRGGALGFRHAIVRDAIAARVADPRRAAIHRAMLASGLAMTTAEYAHHAERAGDHAAAAVAWRR